MAFLIPFNAHDPDMAPALARNIPLWERLAFGEATADPFCAGPQWQLSCQEAFAPWRRIYLKSSDNSLLVFAEMRDDTGNGMLVPLDSDWFFGTSLLGPESVDLLEEAAVELAHEYDPCRLAFFVSGIRSDEAVAALYRRFCARFNLFRHGYSIQSMASLAGGLDGFFSRRSAHHRAKTRRARRRAQDAGIVFERHNPASSEEALKLYQRMLKVEANSWKGLGRCGMTEEGPRKFYAALLRRTARLGRARIIIASHDGEDVGFIFGSIGGLVYRGQQFSYDQDYRQFSLGHVLQIEMIAWLCEEGLARYDLGPCDGEAMQYKYHWIEEIRPIQTIVMVSKA